ncbi:MAG: acyltransferase [Parasporobacterium sp.]|nr:acyltransferase [Parasporobacterium sp.]
METNQSPYALLSRYRSVLMGIAILLIVWYHSSFQFDFVSFEPLRLSLAFLKELCYCGVDIFMFLSGMGIWSSLEKNSISQFARNRFRKILPIWWGYLLIRIAVGALVCDPPYTFLEILGFSTFTGFWLGMPGQGNWFVYFIVLFYMLSPVLYSLLKDSRRKTGMFLLLLAASFLLSLSFAFRFELTGFSRLPVYITGMYTAAVMKEVPMKKKHWLITAGFFVTGTVILLLCYCCFRSYLYDLGLWWYPFILITPSMLLLICAILRVLEKPLKYLFLLFGKCGQASLEILLISDLLYQNNRYIFSEISFLKQFSGNLQVLILMLAAVLLGLVFHLLVELLKKTVSRHFLRFGKS